MSKLLKSKILLGLMVFAVVFAFVAIATPKANASCDLGSITLKQGQRSAAVTCLQVSLGMSQQTGYFGTITLAAVKAFQTNHGLTADGLVGAHTKAALTGSPVMPPVAGSLCPNGMTLASNCTVSPNITPSQNLCPNGNTLASNCMVAPTTGTSTCPSGYVPITPVAPLYATCALGTGANSNGAGNLQSVTLLGSPSNVQVSEGILDNKVLGVELRADSGSNLNIQNIHVNLWNAGAVGSTWLTRYISGVSVWQGNTKIGSIASNQMSVNGATYSATIPFSGVTLAAGATTDFFVSVDANSSIDTNDANAIWAVQVDTLRYGDMSGAILTQNALGIQQPLRFLKLSNNSSVKLTLSQDAGNPLTRVVTDNYTGIVNDVSLLKFDLKAQGSDMYINGMALPVTATGVSNVSQITSYFKLKYNGNVISSYSFPIIGAGPVAIHFGDGFPGSTSLNGGSGQIIIHNGDTGIFEVTADINPMETNATVMARTCTGAGAPVSGCIGAGNPATGAPQLPLYFTGGDSLVVNFPSVVFQTVAGMSVEDQTGANLAANATSRPGSAAGYAATFLNTGLSTTLNSSSAVNTFNQTTGVLTSSAVTMNLSVTAAGSDYYIPRVVLVGTTGGAAPTLADLAADMGTTVGFDIVALDNAYAYDAPAGVLTTGTVNIVSGATLVSGGGVGLIKINSGQTATLTINATIVNTGGALTGQGVKALQLNGVAGSIDQTLGTPIGPFAALPPVLFQSTQTAAF